MLLTKLTASKSKKPIPQSTTSPGQIMHLSRQAPPEVPENATIHTIMSQPSKKRVLKDVTESKAHSYVQLEDLATSWMPLMIENISDLLSTKIDRTLNNLSEALDVKQSRIDHKLDAINSKTKTMTETFTFLQKLSKN